MRFGTMKNLPVAGRAEAGADAAKTVLPCLFSVHGLSQRLYQIRAFFTRAARFFVENAALFCRGRFLCCGVWHGKIKERFARDFACIYGECAAYGVHQRAFACAVSADYGYEVALVYFKVNVLERRFLVYRAGIEGLAHVFQFKHNFFSHCSAPPRCFRP